MRYDSPTWGGFRFETSYGSTALYVFIIVSCDAGKPDFWDAAAFYTADWNSIKLSAACLAYHLD